MSYIYVGVTLTDTQKQSLKNAYTRKQPVTLRLNPHHMVGNDRIVLTKAQHNQFLKHKRMMSGIDIKMSKSQVKKVGGSILSAIIPLLKSMLPKALPILGPLGLAAASGAISGVTNKALSQRGSGMKRRRRGNGLIGKLAGLPGGKIPILGDIPLIGSLF